MTKGCGEAGAMCVFAHCFGIERPSLREKPSALKIILAIAGTPPSLR